MPTVPNIIQADFFIERTQAGFTSMLLASVSGSYNGSFFEHDIFYLALDLNQQTIPQNQ